jgi:hypothetical protein
MDNCSAPDLAETSENLYQPDFVKDRCYIGKCTPKRHITDDKTDTLVSAQHSAPMSL